LGIAAGEFANHGLHGASIEAIAHEAGITQAYVFRMFGTKKALFVELVGAAFDRFSDGMSQAAKGARGLRALALIGGTVLRVAGGPHHTLVAAARLCRLR
jgi:AcrR family transcriptional regulator